MSLFYMAFYASLRHKPESDGRLFFHRTAVEKTYDVQKLYDSPHKRFNKHS